MKQSAAEIDRLWCIDDVCDAHDALDYIDDQRRTEAAKNGQ
jgi:hypothetical protein